MLCFVLFSFYLNYLLNAQILFLIKLSVVCFRSGTCNWLVWNTIARLWLKKKQAFVWSSRKATPFLQINWWMIDNDEHFILWSCNGHWNVLDSCTESRVPRKTSVLGGGSLLWPARTSTTLLIPLKVAEMWIKNKISTNVITIFISYISAFYDHFTHQSKLCWKPKVS